MRGKVEVKGMGGTNAEEEERTARLSIRPPATKEMIAYRRR